MPISLASTFDANLSKSNKSKYSRLRQLSSQTELYMLQSYPQYRDASGSHALLQYIFRHESLTQIFVLHSSNISADIPLYLFTKLSYIGEIRLIDLQYSCKEIISCTPHVYRHDIFIVCTIVDIS